METGEIQFRTAAIGGFLKQDVLDYIEKANREHRERLEQLEKELAAVKGERDALKERAAGLEKDSLERRNQLDHLTGQVESLTAQLAQREKELEEIRGESKLQDELQGELSDQMSDLKARLSKAERGARAYEAIKDRTAGIELEAHYRAQAVEAAAQVQVDKTRREVEQWIAKVQGSYDQMRSDIDATISHASGELERVRRSMEHLTEEFGVHDDALKAILRTYEESVGHKQAPTPLPLEEA